ncbi:MAG: 2-hydroxyglutaryl-CoA dehydratase, partial [Oscillospiraceae bacterium]
MAELVRGKHGRVLFTREMKQEGYTILMPSMAPIHFELIKNVMRKAGYNLVLLTNTGHQVVEEGLKYVHNDT